MDEITHHVAVPDFGPSEGSARPDSVECRLQFGQPMCGGWAGWSLSSGHPR